MRHLSRFLKLMFLCFCTIHEKKELTRKTMSNFVKWSPSMVFPFPLIFKPNDTSIHKLLLSMICYNLSVPAAPYPDTQHPLIFGHPGSVSVSQEVRIWMLTPVLPSSKNTKENAHFSGFVECCGSWLQCFQDPWIRDRKKTCSGSGIWDEHQRSSFRELRNSF